MNPSQLIRRPAPSRRDIAANDDDGEALVPVESNVMDTPTVRGRVLHARLGVSKDLTSWAKAQVQRGRLVEGRDYLLTQQGEQHVSGRKRVTEYHFTVEAANEPVLTMSSREIAELTGKEHFNVRRDIRALLQEFEKDALSFEGMSQDSYGRPLEVFNLPKDLTITLVAGYSAPLRRWLSLEPCAGKRTLAAAR
ncbi:Rha family transcriptional regulator [Roseateles sp.]|uniref:Rha family transcriptional regulator n=1 Tax=Roseateles sp. TaxID=1971397 RepID=UPI0032669E6F